MATELDRMRQVDVKTAADAAAPQEWQRIPIKLRLALELMPAVTALEQLGMQAEALSLVDTIRKLRAGNVSQG